MLIACATCGQQFQVQPGQPGRPRKNCVECRPPKGPQPERREGNERGISRQPGYIAPSRKGQCSSCSKDIQVTHSSATTPMCKACRARSRAQKHKSCLDCGSPSYGLRCRTCADAAKATGRNNELRRDLQRRRAARLAQAPGLTHNQRLNLLATWKSQGRPCTYCDRPAESVDHVIPIALGGTNREGNLTPACLVCNSRKNDSLLIEWKHKRRVRRERVAVVALPPRITKGKTCPVYFSRCEHCDTWFTAKRARRKFCSGLCRSRYHHGSAAVHQCADCAATIPNTRNKCDACVVATKRARRRRQKIAARLRDLENPRGEDARRSA